MYLYKENISLLTSLIVPVAFYSPILLGLTSIKINMEKMNILTLTAFITGFIVMSFITNNNIWPIGLVIWLILSIPALVTLNMTCYVYKRKYA